MFRLDARQGRYTQKAYSTRAARWRSCASRHSSLLRLSWRDRSSHRVATSPLGAFAPPGNIVSLLARVTLSTFLALQTPRAGLSG